MKYLLTMICIATLLVSCNDDDDHEPASIAERTVIVYIAAENNLSGNATEDINEMIVGSKNLSGNTNLIAFVDKNDSNEPPYIAKIENGTLLKDQSYTYTEDFYSSDPERMSEVLNRIIASYPAKSYGLVLWGHASGWLIEKDSINYNGSRNAIRRAYGIDYGRDQQDGDGYKWMNIPTLAKVLERLPQKMTFIFADCCNFQSIETAYELRNSTDYIIASPAEIPDIGAPYDKIVPRLFGTGDDFYRNIVDEYNSMTLNSDSRVPLSVIKTSELEKLAQATVSVMAEMPDETDTDGIIYYRCTASSYRSSSKIKVMCDMNDMIMRHIGNAELYGKWKEAFDRAVVYKAISGKWITAGGSVWTDTGWVKFDFDATEERFGCVSMFFPGAIFDDTDEAYDYNRTIKQMQWYYAAGVDNYYTGNTKN